MKKHYLLALSVVAFQTLGAQAPKGVNLYSAPQTATYGKVFTEKSPAKQDVMGNSAKRREADKTRFIRIGSTYYDLQTNYAMPRRMVQHADSAISAVWIQVAVLVTISVLRQRFGILQTAPVLKIKEQVGLQ